MHTLVIILGNIQEIFPRHEKEQGQIESALAECWELVKVTVTLAVGDCHLPWVTVTTPFGS